MGIASLATFCQLSDFARKVLANVELVIATYLVKDSFNFFHLYETKILG